MTSPAKTRVTWSLPPTPSLPKRWPSLCVTRPATSVPPLPTVLLIASSCRSWPTSTPTRRITAIATAPLTPSQLTLLKTPPRASRRMTARSRRQSSRIPPPAPRISSSPATCFPCAPWTAACSSAVATPRLALISADSLDLSPRPSSASLCARRTVYGSSRWLLGLFQAAWPQNDHDRGSGQVHWGQRLPLNGCAPQKAPSCRGGEARKKKRTPGPWQPLDNDYLTYPACFVFVLFFYYFFFHVSLFLLIIICINCIWSILDITLPTSLHLLCIHVYNPRLLMLWSKPFFDYLFNFAIISDYFI